MTNDTRTDQLPESLATTTLPPAPTEPPGACSGPLPPERGHSPARPSTSAVRGGKASVYDIVTERIVEALARGVVPWRKPWDSPAFQQPRSLSTGKPYRGINFFLLGLAADRFTSPYWITFKQARDRGATVRKGEKGLPVFFWKVYDAKSSADAGDADEADHTGRRFVARYYTVFNAEQCDGLDYPKAQMPDRREVQPIAACDAVCAGYEGGPAIRHGGAAAFYSPVGDVVRMPERERFHSPEEYYSTLFHELVHSTGHATRLARFTADSPPPPFGSADYSREELVAEMGAAFLCADTRISNATIDNAAAYVSGWLKVLKQDSRAVVFAAAAARRAADRILGTGPEEA
jgi:antirestriction protein ArdC